MDYGELRLPPLNNKINVVNGRFMKGHIPANKGRKWNEYMSKRAQKRCARGWKNLEKYRPQHRPDTAGRCKKQVVAIMDDGTFRVFPFLGAAAIFVGGLRENVGRCCRENASHHKNKKTGRINTEHRYMGIKWYYESDPQWVKYIQQ